MKQSKIDSVYLNVYRRCYAAATPPADFDKLVEEAPVDELGQKVIDYNAYVIDEDEFISIMEDEFKKAKLKPYQKAGIRIGLYLGPLPIFKKHLGHEY
jgi:hypothetical protein